MPTMTNPLDDGELEYCPDTDYTFVVTCENTGSVANVFASNQPIGAGVTISAGNQTSGTTTEFTVNVDTRGSYQFTYCCTYDA